MRFAAPPRNTTSFTDDNAAVSRCLVTRAAGVSLDMACVTNVLAAESDGRGSPHAALAKIFEHLSPEGVAIVNADDSLIRDLTKEDLEVLFS